jgi:hypothetical protein
MYSVQHLLTNPSKLQGTPPTDSGHSVPHHQPLGHNEPISLWGCCSHWAQVDLQFIGCHHAGKQKCPVSIGVLTALNWTTFRENHTGPNKGMSISSAQEQ